MNENFFFLSQIFDIYFICLRKEVVVASHGLKNYAVFVAVRNRRQPTFHKTPNENK